MELSAPGDRAGSSFGKYVLVDRISSGGMADVFKAKIRGFRGFTKTVAIKRIHRHLLERRRFLRMFSDEAKIAARLAHPNIVQIYDLGEHEGVPYIAMEFVHGRDLYQVVERIAESGQRVPWPLALRVVDELCKGLHHAHEFRSLDGQPQAIVHRDVSPRNILLSFEGEIKLTDFGVARARDREEHTEHGVIKGKIRYISPESALGREVDRRSDLYSLAVVFAELLTMRPLRDGSNDIELLLAVREGRLDLSHVEALPEAVRRVLARALAVDPVARYATAVELRDAILEACRPDVESMSARDTAAYLRQLFSHEIAVEAENDRRLEARLAEEAQRSLRLAIPPGVAAPLPARPDAEHPLNIFVTATGAAADPRLAPPPAGPAPRTPYTGRPSLEGDLQQLSLARLLHRLCEKGMNGRLDVRREPLVKTLFLEDGRPVFVLSNTESELFGEHLVAHGVISRAQHGATLDHAARHGLRFTEALLALRKVEPSELYRHLAEQVRDRILDIFTWPRGQFAFFKDAVAPEPGMPLNLRTHTLIHEGIQDRVSMGLIRTMLTPHVGHRLVRVGGPLPGDLQLSGRQQRILRTIAAESPTLAELLRKERDEEQILRLVYLLSEIERLDIS